MMLIDQLVEQRVAEAEACGEFDNLPGRGKPLRLEDDALVPEEMRSAYRLLKNAGYLPPELPLRREIRDVEQLIREAEQQEQKSLLNQRLHGLLLRLHIQQADNALLRETVYLEKLTQRLSESEESA